MAAFKIGDRVVVASRQQTPADQKSGLYYNHFADMRGTILKIYGEEASVLVDRDALPNGVRQRHDENEKSERQRYLDRLSDEARNRMTPKEKEFGLQYAILVSVSDLTREKGTPANAAPAKRLTEAELAAAEEAELKKRTGGKG